MDQEKGRSTNHHNKYLRVTVGPLRSQIGSAYVDEIINGKVYTPS